jgi:hypothetical protein
MQSKRILRTDLVGFDDLVMLERIKVVLDIDGRTFLDRTGTKERVGRGGTLHE